MALRGNSQLGEIPGGILGMGEAGVFGGTPNSRREGASWCIQNLGKIDFLGGVSTQMGKFPAFPKSLFCTGIVPAEPRAGKCPGRFRAGEGEGKGQGCSHPSGIWDLDLTGRAWG